jgi:hypothetical protein
MPSIHSIKLCGTSTYLHTYTKKFIIYIYIYKPAHHPNRPLNWWYEYMIFPTRCNISPVNIRINKIETLLLKFTYREYIVITHVNFDTLTFPTSGPVHIYCRNRWVVLLVWPILAVCSTCPTRTISSFLVQKPLIWALTDRVVVVPPAELMTVSYLPGKPSLISPLPKARNMISPSNAQLSDKPDALVSTVPSPLF